MGNLKTVVLVLWALLILVAPAVSQTPDDHLIVPGVRLGKWTLAMTIDDLVRMNGPAEIRQIMGGIAPYADSPDIVIFAWPPLDLGAYTFDRKKVEGLITGESAIINYKTAEGVRLQDTRSEIVAAYGKPTVETIPRVGWKRLIYDKIGLSFTVLDAGGEIRHIQVFRPGTAKNRWKY